MEFCRIRGSHFPVLSEPKKHFRNNSVYFYRNYTKSTGKLKPQPGFDALFFRPDEGRCISSR